jgi:hypothetical protein
MKYSFFAIFVLCVVPVCAEDEYMVIGPERGAEKELIFEPTSTLGDSPKSDILDGGDMVEE